MIKIGDTTIDPREIEFTEWSHRHYVNGSTSTLVIHLKSGRTIRVDGGPEAYEAERVFKESRR